MRLVDRRCLGWLLTVALAAAACGQAETSAQTSAPSRSPDTRASSAQAAATSAATPLVLEFDIPAEFAEGGVVTGFRVGFFRGNESTAIRTVDVARESLTVSGRTARVTVARENVPQCSGDCVVRVQTLSRTQASAWSDPVPLGGPAARGNPTAAPQRPPQRTERQVAIPGRPRAQSRLRRTAGLTAADIEKHTSLSESLRGVLPKGANVDAELRRFRRVPDLAMAVVLSRDYDIPFTTLSQTLAGPPRVTPREALTKLRQDVNAGEAIRKARLEARKFVETPQGAGGQP